MGVIEWLEVIGCDGMGVIEWVEVIESDSGRCS